MRESWAGPPTGYTTCRRSVCCVMRLDIQVCLLIVSRRRLQMEPDERAIREVHSTWIDAVNAGDLVCLVSLMPEDAVFLTPGQAPIGREGFSPGFLAARQQTRIN